MKFFDSDLYYNYDKMLSAIGDNIIIKQSFYKEFTKSEIKKTLIQKIDLELCREFGIYVNKKIKKGLNPFNDLNGRIKLNSFIISDSILRVRVKLFFFCIAKFFYNYFFLLINIFKIIFQKKIKIICQNVLLENLFNVSSEDKLHESYKTVKESKIDILKNNLLVRGKVKFNLHEKSGLTFKENPFIYLLKDIGHSNIDLLFLFFKILLSPVKFFYYILFNPLLVLIYKDFIFFPLIKFLNERKKIKNIIFSTSQIHFQELWLKKFNNRNFETHFLNYSNNSNQFVYRNSKHKSHYPWLKHISADHHWVWTENQKVYYKSLGLSGQFHVIDPLLINFPKIITNNIDDNLTIAIFDIPSFKKDFIKNKLGIINYYYSPKNMFKFLNDIIEVVDELEITFDLKIKIILKNKRQKNKLYDSKNFENISYLEKINNNFECVSPDTNIYSLISSSLCTISIPYTATASVASYLNRNSIYYDPTNSLARPKYFEPNINYIFKKNHLKNTLRNLILKELKL